MRGDQVMRSSLIIPDKVLGQFSQILTDYDEKMNADEKDIKHAASDSEEGSRGEEVGSDKKVKVDDD